MSLGSGVPSSEPWPPPDDPCPDGCSEDRVGRGVRVLGRSSERRAEGRTDADDDRRGVAVAVPRGAGEVSLERATEVGLGADGDALAWLAVLLELLEGPTLVAGFGCWSRVTNASAAPSGRPVEAPRTAEFSAAALVAASSTPATESAVTAGIRRTRHPLDAGQDASALPR